jgi:hypothetical protein
MFWVLGNNQPFFSHLIATRIKKEVKRGGYETVLRKWETMILTIRKEG